MKKLYKYLIMLGLFTMTLASCEEFLDVNEDPDSPTSSEITEATTLPGLLGRWAYNGICSRGVDAFYQTLQWVRVGAPPTGLWGNYVHADNSGGPWGMFTSIQKHAVRLEAMAAENGNPHYQGIAQIIMAWGWANLTDYYGPIPLTESFQFPEITNPVFDDQQSVYTEVFRLLDAAIVNLQTSEDAQTRVVRNDDLVFEGDMDKWIKLAYSLKARYTMRLCYAPGITTTTQVGAVLTALLNGMASSDDDALFRHYTGTGFQSGYYEHGPNWTDVQRLTPCKYMVDTMNYNNDPRRAIYFDVEETGIYQGWISGEYILGGDAPSYISESFVGPTYPETFMNYVECKFLEAEAYVLQSDFTNAQDAWEEAVTANMEGLGLDNSDITPYIAQFTFPSTVEEAQAFVMMQKYIANFTTNSEVYFDFVRTGYPVMKFQEFLLGAVSNETTPRRWPYPTSEKERNSNCPDNNFNALFTKVWWDNKSMK
ncbi:MAG TPA: hypothetical protein DEQ09_03185 [Bacteroidales bacterium]|nr:hypothetical protein [Bacteroidales bacterium]